jgi:putative membrane protein
MDTINEKNTFSMSREHLANERTFLAWIRTSIALMGFGFVIIKFSLFLQELAYWMEPDSGKIDQNSPVIGIVMVGVGIIVALISYIRYRKISRQLDKKTFTNRIIFSLVLTIFLVVTGILVFVWYLVPMFD